MNSEKVLFAFFILLAATLNFGFFVGATHDSGHHNVYELFAALVISLIATVMKFGDRTHMGAVLLATSLVADLQLIIAAFVWAYANNVSDPADLESLMTSVVSLSAGALLATAFMHLLPEAVESQAGAKELFATLLVGLVFFFLLDKAELWHHGHEHHHSADGNDAHGHAHAPGGHQH